mmetsp:Transcript_17703/g.20145  ORF Transcript_17703/g.20145 Transcript_17703/m.20145 type:complete len:228 (-) Transcript_17703:149-832(-)
MAVAASDITVQALLSEEKNVARLQKIASELKLRFEEAQQEANAAAQALEWKRLLRRIEDDDLLKATVADLRKAIAVYHASFREPDGYRAHEGGEESPVDYTATDDYADFTGVDKCVDDVLDSMHEQLDAGNVDRAALLLLICSAEIGREVRLATEQAKSSSGAPIAEIEECRDGIASEWQQLFFDGSLSEGDAEYNTVGSGRLQKEAAMQWHRIVATHLGSPFDSRQ